ncbi:MAG TPA: DUF4402 domain-containing protein [Candidatus Kryptobacter bacterium]|nr:DUF4402 domain-containing protein [Candidatus Kryptobacter bacterium]
MKRLVQIGLMLMLALSANQAMAQNPVITVMRDLSFGMVITTTTSTIAPFDPAAAEIEIQFPNYNSMVFVSVTFGLPGNLTSGANNLPITFGTNSAAWNTTSSFSGSTLFDPSTGYTNFFTSNAPLTIYVWIGGSISPGGGQAAGVYTGTITVNASAFTFSWPNFKNYQANQNIPISADIIRGLSITSTGVLNFGLIVAGTTPPAQTAQSGTAPLITAAGNSGRRITVTYSATTFLNDGFGHTLTFTPSVYGSNIAGDQAGATVVASGSNVYLSGSGRVTGYYYFWLGGALSPVPTVQPAGNYSGTFTLTVNY